MVSPFLSEAVVIVNPGTEASPYGGTREDWATAERVTAYGFITQRGMSDNAADSGRTVDDSRWGLVLRGNPPVTQQSRVEYRGEVFRVATRPKKVGIRGQVRHVEVVLAPLGDA